MRGSGNTYFAVKSGVEVEIEWLLPTPLGDCHIGAHGAGIGEFGFREFGLDV
jgi:hypothetical protein